MSSLNEVKNRINSIRSTRKITSAMKMVASAKLHKAQAAIENMLPYQEKMNQILTRFLNSADTSLHSPFTAEREIKRVAIIVYSSNSSLCGAFNANIMKRFAEVADRYKNLKKEDIHVYPIGRKIEEAVQKLGYHTEGTYQPLAAKPAYEEAAQLAETLIAQFLAGKLDRVEIIYHHLHSVGTQELWNETYLPVNLTHTEETHAEETHTTPRRMPIDYIVEPSLEEFLAALLPTVLKLKIYTSLLDSHASEHAARVMAMQVATDNANDLIRDLTKQYNKTRQQAITNELLDIIGGSMK